VINCVRKIRHQKWPLKAPSKTVHINYKPPSVHNNENNINIQLLRNKCNFLTIKERLVFVILKLSYKDAYLNPNFLDKQKKSVLTFPRAKIHTHTSQTFKRSYNYKSSSMWNKLPRNWTFNEMTYDMFKEQIKDWIDNNRNDDFVYY